MGLVAEERTKEKQLYRLSDPILCLSRQRDYVRLVDMVRGGAIILGGPGSGKTTGSYEALMRASFKAGHGAFVHCRNEDAVASAIRIARETGRTKQTRVLRPKEFCFPFIDYAIAHHREEESVISECVEVLYAGLQPMRRDLGRQSGENPFFTASGKRLLGKLMLIDRLGNGSINLLRILRMIQAIPPNLAAVETALQEPERSRSFLLQQLAMARKNCPRDQQLELQLADEHVMYEMANLNHETKSSITITATTEIAPMLDYPLLGMFSGEPTITPDEIVYNGAIVILDCTPAQYPVAGRVAGCIFKRSVQNALLRRGKDSERNPDEQIPVGIWADEAALWASEFDQQFAEKCRSARGYLVYTAQSVSTLASAFGGGEVGMSAAKALLDVLQVRVGHANLCNTTNTWFADSLGKIKIRKPTESWSESSQRGALGGYEKTVNRSVSFTEVDEYELPPRAFVGLQTGGDDSKPRRTVEGIFVIGGRQFKANGRRYLKVRLKQGDLGERTDVFILTSPEARDWVNYVRPSDVLRAFLKEFSQGMAEFYRWANFWTKGQAFWNEPGGGGRTHE